MEGLDTLEKSYKALLKLRKDLNTSEVTINFNEIDSKSAGAIKNAINVVLRDRIPILADTITTGSSTNSKF